MERMSMKRWVVLTTIVVGLGVIGSLTRMPAAQGQEPAAPERLQRLPQQVTPQTGQQLYRQACAPCHGIRGDGQGPAAGNAILWFRAVRPYSAALSDYRPFEEKI